MERKMNGGERDNLLGICVRCSHSNNGIVESVSENSAHPHASISAQLLTQFGWAAFGIGGCGGWQRERERGVTLEE